MKSVMTSRFNSVEGPEVPRSQFDRSHGVKSTFDIDDLIPIYVDEAVPGDTFSLNMTGFARMATPLHPIMDNMFMETFFFAISKRLVWENWNKFMGEQDNPGDSIDYTIPSHTTTQAVQAGQLRDYMGLPIGVSGIKFNVLPERCYRLVWNEWFRSQVLQNSVTVDKGDAHVTNGNVVLKRNKAADYFTRALPWPQRGEAVALPLGQYAEVEGIMVNNTNPTTGSVSGRETGALSTVTYTQYWDSAATGSNNIYIEEDDTQTVIQNYPGIFTDLSDAVGATINDLRQAFQIQKLLERDARGGTRLVEVIYSHFGVVSPDARMQRPEYLGGGRTMVNISPVAQTADTAAGKVGDLAAYGTASLSGHGFTHSFTEHCYVLGLVNVRADITYQKGLDRLYSRETRYDFYFPALAHIGEQAVLNKEIYVDGTSDDNEVFGYQERFGEMRVKHSTISGLFNSEAAASLDAWHLSEDFATRPALNADFIEASTPLDRCIAVPTEPHFIFDAYIRLRCARPMPMYGTPGFIDRF